ncbi:MAG: hypothetical protein WC915_06800, partial [archaeon]
MKKQQKYILVISSISLILIAVLFWTGALRVGEDNTLSVVGSYQCSGQVLSIDSAQIYTSSDLGGKKVIRVTYSTLPSSECLNIKIDPSSINNALSSSDKSKFKATNTIYGDIKLTKSQKIYNINEISSEVFKTIGLDLLPGYNALLKPCWDSNCKNSFSSTFASNMYSGSLWSVTADKCVCSSDLPKGINGEFSVSESLRWETQIDIAGQSITLTPTKTSDRIGNIAFVKWSGNFASNDQLGSITNRQAYKPYSDNQWRMIDYGTYTDLNNKYSTLRSSLISCDSIGGQCETSVDSAYGFNSEFDSKTSNKLQTWINGNSLVESATISSNQMIVNLNSPIVYPTFTLDIDASEVGIFITSGEPDVTCPVINDVLVSGQTKDVIINLKNIGSDSGSFDYSVSCDKGSQYVQPSPPQQINAGSNININTRLGLTVTSGTDTSHCTVNTRDINSLKSDSCTFSYTSQHQSQCTAGTKSCEIGNTELWTCRIDGNYDTQKCQYGCWFNNGEYSCKAQDESNNSNNGKCQTCEKFAISTLFGSLLKEQKCDPKTGSLVVGIGESLINMIFGKVLPEDYPQNYTTCSYAFVKIGIVLILFIFTILFSLGNLDKFNILKGKKKGTARFIVSLILAIIVSYIVYVTFLIGIILFIG